MIKASLFYPCPCALTPIRDCSGYFFSADDAGPGFFSPEENVNFVIGFFGKGGVFAGFETAIIIPLKVVP